MPPHLYRAIVPPPTNGHPRPEQPEERAFADRRDKLHASLDALGARVPSDADLFELVECARATFPPYQAAARILAALARHPAVAAVLAREAADVT